MVVNKIENIEAYPYAFAISNTDKDFKNEIIDWLTINLQGLACMTTCTSSLRRFDSKKGDLEVLTTEYFCPPQNNDSNMKFPLSTNTKSNLITISFQEESDAVAFKLNFTK